MFQMIREERANGPVMLQKRRGNIEYLTFDNLEKTGIVEHLFTTRMGGVSQGIFATMNLSFTRGDEEACVLENYKRIATILGCEVEDMVASHQTHTTNIRRITVADKGKRVVVPGDYEDVDGLICNEPGIALATFYADCVPLYFVDPVNKAIGLAHSGWRGTVGQMGAHIVRAMEEEFGSCPKDLIAAIGPSICRDCYEVSEDVVEAFRELAMSEEALTVLQEIEANGCYARKDGRKPELVIAGQREGKYQLDLWLANLMILRLAGIPLTQIAVTDVCTCHNPEYLFSHRASQGKRGNLGAFLMLKTSF